MDNFFNNSVVKSAKTLSGINKRFFEATKSPVISAIPAIVGFAQTKLNDIAKPFAQFNKTFETEFKNITKIAIHAYNCFEKYMRNEYELRNEIKLKWKNLEDELKYNNRSFPNSDFISLFEECVNEASFTFEEGYTFYRAREIDVTDISEEVIKLINKVSEKYEEYEYQKQSDKEKDILNYLHSLTDEEWQNEYVNELDINNINFWGYNAENSDAPPREKTISGRVNPSGISCLYAAAEPMTAISEIQPTIGQTVSVAEIKIKNKLSLFNFDFYEAVKNNEKFEKSLTELNQELKIPVEQLKIIFETVSELFSKPSLGNTENYLVTQYLSAFIKSKGFDGIVFKSSLHENGINIVLFDTSKDDSGNPLNYDIKNSKLIKVDKVEIHYKQILPKKINSNFVK